MMLKSPLRYPGGKAKLFNFVSGPIGGLKQRGPWKIDARFNRKVLIEEIQEIAKFRDQIEFTNFDALDFIKARVSQRNTFTYLDPPYYVKGYKLYTNFYHHEDHEEIADALWRRKRSKWILSYDNVPEIESLYSGFHFTRMQIGYSAGTSSMGDEVMFFSDALSLPNSAAKRSYA